MTKLYYCKKCNITVIPVTGYFNHPTEGCSPSKICPRCETMIYIKEE